MRAFMLSIPVEVMEAARVDGAGQIRTFVVDRAADEPQRADHRRRCSRSCSAWGDFLFALTLTTTEDVRPVTLGLYPYIGTYVNDWSSVMATAVLASIPAVVLLVVAQRYVAAGATAGAVK